VSDLPDDLVELDRLLGDLPLEEEAMILSQVDGLIAAILVVPEPIAPEEWLKLIWGGADRPFADQARTDRLIELVMARKAGVAGALIKGGLRYKPLYEFDPLHDETLWEVWIDGFTQGIQLRREAWLARLKDEDERLAFAATGLTILVDASLNPGKHSEAAADAPDLIPELVEAVYRLQRRLPCESETVASPPAAVKPGRNAPCPCGSGRKFKKCCGAG